jgi:hypothetical protein
VAPAEGLLMPRLGKRRRLGKNIYEDSGSIEASVRVTVHGERLCRYKRYPKGTELKQIRPWQRETAQELRKLKGPASVDTIAADVERYLPLVREELASFSDRERHLRAWIPVVGHLKADALETSAIDTQLRKWRNIDRLSASTVNQRRDALSDLFVKLYPTLTNPVKVRSGSRGKRARRKASTAAGSRACSSTWTRIGKRAGGCR